MEPLTRELSKIALALEDRWIARIADLEKHGQTYGDQEYDAAVANLCAVADEFCIWDKE